MSARVENDKGVSLPKKLLCAQCQEGSTGSH